MRVVGILLVLAVLAGAGYHYRAEILGYFSDAGSPARLAGDLLIEDAGPAMVAIARNAESKGTLRGAGVGVAVKPSSRGARIYGSDGFFLVGSNGVIQAQSPQHGVGLTLTPELRDGRVVWRCSSTVPRDRLTSQCK
ncbi:MAG: hypothetical protein LJE97_14955 [Betaproteobacteria bacterium]|jgi:hypothetical protein|nr:hypothetical protein [Betaproteobacteria bacterium]